mgnify:CR=1 FL=1
MSTKRLKLISIVLVVFIMISAVGCTTSTKVDSDTGDSKSSNVSETNDKTSARDNKTPAANEEPMTLNWTGAEYGPVNEDAPIKKFFEEKFNVKFNLTYVEASKYEEIMNLRFASNDIPDVFNAKNVTMLTTWANQDLLAEVSEQTLRKYAPNIAKEIDSYKKFDQKVWEYSKVNGKSYGILYHNADLVYPSPVIWRDDWLKNVGINKIPETIDEFETALYKFAKEDPDKNGKDDTYGLSSDGMNAIYGTSGYWPSFWNKSGDGVVWGGIQPEMKEVLRLLNKWYKDGVIDPEFVTGENQGGYWAISHSFSNGRIGMTARASYYHWNPPYYEGALGGSNYQSFYSIQPETATYAFGRPAIGKDGKTGMSIGGVIAQFTVFGYHLDEETEKLAKILEILDTLASDYDLYLIAKFGFEGEHWDYSKEKEPVPREEYKEASAAATIGLSNCFVIWQSMDFYRKTRPYHFEFAEKVVNYERYVNEVPIGLPSTAKYKADLDKLQEQTYLKLITGDLPIDAFDDFVTQWLQLGGEQLTKEANDWYKSATAGN